MNELAINGGTPVRDTLLGYGHQLIGDDDIQAVVNVLKSDFLTCGPATAAFESALSERVGAEYVTAVSSGTAALHVACLAAGIREGDEVIVSPITFAASANCVHYCGGTAVFADIDPETWQIDPAKIEEKINDKTKAVVAVDFGGCTPDVQAIRDICSRYNLTYIEDAAHSIGSTVEGRPVGSLADITCFSFHPVKTVVTGEGGAVATCAETLATKVELFAKHGITRRLDLMREPKVGGWHYEQLELGYNYRISDIQAALGTSQLAKLDQFATRRRELVAYYNREFSSIPEVTFQKDEHPEESVRHLYCLRFDFEKLGTTRRQIFDALRAEGIGVNVHYLPVYLLPWYMDIGHTAGECPNAEAYYEQAVTLPLHCSVTDSDAHDVVTAVRKVVEFYKTNKSAR